MPKKLLRFLASLFAITVLAYGYDTYAHRSGCHASHSCPSDTGSYICGDTGNCSQCADNEFCSNKKPIGKTAEPAKPEATPVVEPVKTESTVQTNAIVTKTVDGDTLHAKLDGETDDVTVRLLGINTPESVDPRRPVECFGKEASKHAKELLEGKRIRLEADPQADERDKYGRLLRKVIMEDGKNFNTLMVSEGYATAYVSFPMDANYKRELKKLEEEARLAKRGLWATETCNGKK